MHANSSLSPSQALSLSRVCACAPFPLGQLETPPGYKPPQGKTAAATFERRALL